jgi:tetratricopeptide (TPR) repeat protein
MLKLLKLKMIRKRVRFNRWCTNGQYQDAIEDCKEFFNSLSEREGIPKNELASHKNDVLAKQGYSLLCAENMDAAITAFSEILKSPLGEVSEDTKFAALVYRGLCYEDKGLTTEAKTDYAAAKLIEKLHENWKGRLNIILPNANFDFTNSEILLKAMH